MRASNGMRIAVGALGALVVVVGVFVHERADGGASPRSFESVDNSATAKCQGSIVELEFDPEGHIEARTHGKTVASADVEGRELSYDTCAKAPTQGGWAQSGVRYTKLHKQTTLTCRFPGRFFIHIHPVSASWAGERPAGSAVYLVLGKRVSPGPGPQRTILASASVMERSSESDVVFVRRYCTPRF
jgi:hypothetical protein